MNLGENIIIWILEKSRSVAPAKLEIKLVSPKGACSNFKVWYIFRNAIGNME